MNGPQDVADAVVRIPRDFEARGDASFRSLLMASGYAQEHAAVDVPMIESALRAHPEFVKDWLQHSEDKRTSAGGFLRRVGSGDWEVGYVDGGAPDQVSVYQEELAACAAFVKEEIDAVRASVS